MEIIKLEGWNAGRGNVVIAPEYPILESSWFRPFVLNEGHITTLEYVATHIRSRYPDGVLVKSVVDLWISSLKRAMHITGNFMIRVHRNDIYDLCKRCLSIIDIAREDKSYTPIVTLMFEKLLPAMDKEDANKIMVEVVIDDL